LAVSTKDHIDVISLEDATSVTVVTYPVLLDGYYPEVVWSPDASGFKTVILPQANNNQAELIFAFTDGTVASLAKFTIVPFSESLPYISPDGGYVIYAAKVSDGKESLYLMDSSGATKPYGETADNIRANGWLPDSKHFVYSDEVLSRAFLGDVGGAFLELTVTFPLMIRWVDAEHYVALENGELMLSNLSGASVQIDSTVFDFDFMR
jgi:Tol biopolymer transport system component